MAHRPPHRPLNQTKPTCNTQYHASPVHQGPGVALDLALNDGAAQAVLEVSTGILRGWLQLWLQPANQLSSLWCLIPVVVLDCGV